MKQQALILGGTTGIGKSTAEYLLNDGIDVILIGRNTSNLENAQKDLSPLGTVTTIQLDLSDQMAVRAFSKTLENIAPNLKHLVNAAGYFSPKPFLEHSESDYDTYHNFNKAFFFIT